MASAEATASLKEVSEVILQKVLRFAQERKTFKMKELFEAYPNNPPLLLRDGVNYLRQDKKLYMVGDKRGAYYTIEKVSEEEQAVIQEKKQEEKLVGKATLKDLVFAKCKTFARWFKRTEIEIPGYQGIDILKTVQSLVEEKKLQTRGAKRWTEYAMPGVRDNLDASVDDDTDDDFNEEQLKSIDQELKLKVLEFIIQKKVVTVPMVMETLELQRYVVVPILEVLCREEEIWHEGVKKASKYVYKNVDIKHVDTIAQQNREEIIQEKLKPIDHLSADLAGNIRVHTYFNTDLGKHQLKFMRDGSRIKVLDFDTPEDIANFLMDATERTNNARKTVN